MCTFTTTSPPSPPLPPPSPLPAAPVHGDGVCGGWGCGHAHQERRLPPSGDGPHVLLRDSAGTRVHPQLRHHPQRPQARQVSLPIMHVIIMGGKWGGWEEGRGGWGGGGGAGGEGRGDWFEKCVLLTSPMRGRGYSTHSVGLCVCVSATTLAGATRTLRAQLRYQQKALVTRNKTNVGIGLKHLSSKVMTVCSSPRIL